ncbi:hypothetical protein MSG28_008442 [Choristoneura fumiferana]|uniref:Uncharacterized protein n=2 Tax=Choristoneura fumiferana TaxID=7141 RepID=A0ACC0J5J3_CHOFU|nr:hypothetical protein MSG28_008442 [Choristoneura fumiferana]
MSGGELCALGSAGALRAQHAAGHAVVFKLRATDDADYTKRNVIVNKWIKSAAASENFTDGGDAGDCASSMEQFKGELHRIFDCALKDEHQTMLHYHINDTMRYSELFSNIETLKQTFPQLVEDYTVTETTLEEVFLSFAREAQENAEV